jgi:MFS family permease
VTQFALIGLFSVLPRVILSPLAGAIVDRWDRRWVMILSDVGAGLSTLSVAILFFTGRLEIWYIYLLVCINAAFGTLQWPAYISTTASLVPKQSLGRANGLVQFGQGLAEILAPALAGSLILSVGLEGVILLDFVTFVLAVMTLLAVRLPKLENHGTAQAGNNAFWNDMLFGWRYLSERKGLLGLLGFLAAVNFLWGMVGALITPMILGFTSSDVLGIIISIAGAGMLAGSLVMSAWGGPRRRINGVLLFEALSGGCFMLIGLRPSFWPVALGAFGAHLTIAIVYGSNQAIWQSKVEPGAQGRVFAVQQMVTRATSPLAYLAAGPLAERLFGSLLIQGGFLAHNLGKVIGIGPGRGMGLLFILMGMIKVAVVLVGYANPRVRLVEDELSDWK